MPTIQTPGLNYLPMDVHTQMEQPQVVVLMVPLPAQGHLNQLLHLSRLISSYNNIQIHYVGSPSHCRQAKIRFHGWNHLVSTPNIHFHEFSTPSFVSPPPDPNAIVKFPSHLQPSFDASSHLREPVAKLMKSLSLVAERVVVIHDSLMASVVQDFVSLPNAESYAFHSVSVFCSFFFRWERNGRPFRVDEKILQHLPPMDDCFTPEFQEFVKYQYDHIKSASGRIYNSCRIIEGPFLELIKKEEISENEMQWALGPFNPVEVIEQKERHKCLQWLDKQKPNSVLYVSFGTTTSMSDEQIKELAIGLEKSTQNFLWVVRDADKGNIFDETRRSVRLPQGFEERVQEKGLIVRSWAPQLEILGHEATGGFMSHCGWNSCMESITMGVPIATWPMHSDQPRNAVLITQVLKIGVSVKDWGCNDQMVMATMVEEAVRKLMVEEAGGEIRRRAAELGVAVRISVAEGGVARMELDSFIAHICR